MRPLWRCLLLVVVKPAPDLLLYLRVQCTSCNFYPLLMLLASLQPGDVTLFLADGTGEFYALAGDNCRYKLSEVRFCRKVECR